MGQSPGSGVPVPSASSQTARGQEERAPQPRLRGSASIADGLSRSVWNPRESCIQATQQCLPLCCRLLPACRSLRTFPPTKLLISTNRSTESSPLTRQPSSWAVSPRVLLQCEWTQPPLGKNLPPAGPRADRGLHCPLPGSPRRRPAVRSHPLTQGGLAQRRDLPRYWHTRLCSGASVFSTQRNR